MCLVNNKYWTGFLKILFLSHNPQSSKPSKKQIIKMYFTGLVLAGMSWWSFSGLVCAIVSSEF